LSQNFFTLVNSDNIETPEELEKCMEINSKLLKNIYDEQIYLLDLGVSLEYSDSLSSNQRFELIQYSKEYRKILDERSQSRIL